MIENNYIYVDKTKIIYSLLQKSRLFFLSRPRRFGKSLLLSTLYELFSGNKKLFNDTWIGQSSDYDWKEYPVVYLDFSKLNNSSQVDFINDLIWQLKKIAKNYNLTIEEAPSLEAKCEFLIEQLARNNRVVILIDEYDYPLLQYLSNSSLARELQRVIKNFFATLKSVDGAGHIHSIFITGVTRFSKTSIFSGMNNLHDISMSSDAAELLGYTKDDLKQYFHDYIKELAESNNLSLNQAYAAIKEHYNGYRFSDELLYVYNPFSALHCLLTKKFKNFWFQSGTPSFLINLIKEQGNALQDIETIDLDSSSFGIFDIESLHIIPVLFQTGYLTIREYHQQDDRYVLGYPNQEVRESFNKYLIAILVGKTNQEIDPLLQQFKQALEQNNIELFCALLKTLFAHIPYQLHLSYEAYYHSLLQFLTTLLSLRGNSEISSDKGRIDFVLETKTHIIIFELKFESNAQKALDQIIAKKYYEKYMFLHKNITLAGLSFNRTDKELTIDCVYQDWTP